MGMCLRLCKTNYGVYVMQELSLLGRQLVELIIKREDAERFREVWDHNASSSELYKELADRALDELKNGVSVTELDFIYRKVNEKVICKCGHRKNSDLEQCRRCKPEEFEDEQEGVRL